MANRPFKAADIDDRSILLEVYNQCCQRGYWTNTTKVAETFQQFPFKVVAAKLSKLLNRGLIDGCDCGCRGDWELTNKGFEYLGITPHNWRRSFSSDDIQALIDKTLGR